MQTIIGTIITGLFSLAGIWYQNYLSKRSNRTDGFPVQPTVKELANNQEKAPPVYSKQDYKPTVRIVFTILIVTIPWLSFNHLLRFVDIYTFKHSTAASAIHHNLLIVRNEIALYCSVWLIITVAALLSGWKRKTVFEKIILIASALWLIGIGCVRCIQYNKLAVSYQTSTGASMRVIRNKVYS